jgi:hypothetical protein
MRSDKEVPLRIILVAPPSGVLFALQRGRGELVSATLARGRDLSFELAPRVAGGEDARNFLGPFVQGPRGGRFVYVNSGTYAGQIDTPWSRRAKVGLQGITRQLVDRVTSASGKVLEARIAGTGKDGGPACATVPLLDGGWKLARK